MKHPILPHTHHSNHRLTRQKRRRGLQLLLLAVLCWTGAVTPLQGQLQVPAIPSNTQLSNQYEFDAEYVYRVDLDGAFLEDGTLVAYVNGELRGAQSASVQFPPTGEYIYKVRVFSNDPSGDTVTFRYFDVFDNKVYEVDEYEIFEADHVPDYYTPTLLTAVCGAPGQASGLLPEDGATGLSEAPDLFWQPSDNTLRYDLYLWKDGEAVPGSPTQDDLYSSSARVNGLEYGASYHWFVVSENQCLRDTSLTQSFTVRKLSDLVISNLDVPDTTLTATSFPVTYTVTNQGSGATPGRTWYDALYLSGDNTLSGDDERLGRYDRIRALQSDSSYTQTVTVSVPSGYEGTWYLVGVTDQSDRIRESDPGNNTIPSGVILVQRKPLPDIRVSEITAGGVLYDPGDSIEVSWKVDNPGNAPAAGGWTEKVSIVSLSGIRVELDDVPQFSDTLETGEEVTRNHRFRLPRVMQFAEEAYVEVELVPSDELEEYPGDEDNNHTASQNRITVRNALYLEIPESAAEDYSGTLRCYVTRSGSYTRALTVNLSAAMNGQISMPSTVTIPERNSSSVFELTVTDNSELDGTRRVAVEAAADAYDAVSDTLRILDDEKPSLSLSLESSTLSEGDTVRLTVSRDLVSGDSVKVLLSTALERQWSFPGMLTIPSGEGSTTAEVAVVADPVPELNEEATITARAEGMISGSVTATIVDDDIPALEMEILADSVSEGAGPYAAYGVIRRTGDNTGPVRVDLAAGTGDVLYFPSSVGLDEGVMEKQFNVGVIDNQLVDGYRTVELRGMIYIPSCNCTTTPNNGGVVSDSITVADNDGPSLTVTVSPVSLKEGLSDAGTVTIFRNTDATGELEVNLGTNDTSEISVPATATLPAGETTVDVTVATLDDQVDDGSQMVSVRAEAEDFSPGIAWVNVTDINRPDLEMSDITLHSDTVVTERQMEVQVVVPNNGYGKAPSEVPVKFYLSENRRVDERDSVVYEGVLDDQIAIGGSYSFMELVRVPRVTGDYWLIGKVNPDATVTELLYTNNESAPVEITVVPNYEGTARVEQESFEEPVPVTITGEATLINGDPAPGADLDVYVISTNNGNRRVIEVTTGEDGSFSAEFEPFSYESGHYIVGACYPGRGLTDEQDAFDIMGMERTSNDYLTWNLKKDVPSTGTIGIRNRSEVPLTNVIFEPQDMPEGFTLEIDTIASLPGSKTVYFNYTAFGEILTGGKNYVEVPVTVSSDEGISFDFKAYYYCQALGSHLVSDPASINTSITKEKTRYYDIRLVNEGAGETGTVTMELPDQEWMSLASSDTLETIPSGDTVTATLMFAPGSDIPLNTPLSGRIVAHTEIGDDLAIPYQVEVVSEETGGLRVDVVDEYTYFTDDAPHVEGAHVVVRHPYSGEIMAEGFSDQDGIFAVDSLNEGSYRLTVEAHQHEGYQDVVVIDPGRVNKQTVFLSFQSISYTWEVVPTEIEDEYEVELVMEYETNVPAPVVIMEMPDEMPQLFNDETYTFVVTLTNKGLITAQDVELEFPEDDPVYEWVTDFSSMDLLAQQAIQVPVTMRIKEGATGGTKSKTVGNGPKNGGGPCSDYAMTFYGFECGSDRQLKQTNEIFSISGRTCGGGGSTGPGGTDPIPTGSGGGPGSPGGETSTYTSSGGTASTISPSTGCDPCLLTGSLTILGCVGPPIGDVLSCGYGFADGDVSLMDAGGCVPKVGCVIGVIGTIQTCYNTPPFGPWGGGGASTKSASGGESKGNNIPPVIEQAATELDYALYSDQAARDYFSEYMGDLDWQNKESFHDFTVVADSVVTNKVPFDQATIDELKNTMEGTDITQDEVDAFVDRWNQTMEAWDQGIRTPNATYPNMINRDSLDIFFDRMKVSRDYALSLGYMSVSDMKYQAYQTLKEEMEDKRSSVCASVSIEISQKLVMTREAFEGTLTIYNGNTTTAMEEVELNLEVRNEAGELANDLFEIETKALDILTGIDGTGTLGPDETGSATVLFIPEKGAAPEVPQSYSFGGSFSYLDPFTGTTVEKTLFPVTLEVNPSPDLYLHYFMQRDILGDDPLTEPIEPIIPAELAVMVENNGYGEARNVRIESAQPEIVDNEKGLAIHFELIGSNLNGEPTQLGLTDIDFGSIAPKSTKIGQWWFTADLMGHFVDYEANLTHLDSRGNPDLSLVSGAELHELIRSIRVYGSTDDGINDFLVNSYQDSEEQPDVIYLSQGEQLLDVHGADVSLFEGDLRSPEFTNTLRVVNSKIGWNYIRLPDPGNGRYELVSITRNSDGQEIPVDNAWLTHVTMRDGKEPVYEDKFHMVDRFEDIGEQTYTVTWNLKEPNPPAVKRIDGVPDAFVGQPVTGVTVTFNKEIDPATFTWEDMMLRLQGGEDIMDSTVTITQVDATTYEVDLSMLTTGNGFYVLTVQAAGVEDLDGTPGEVGKQAAWTQFLDVPVVEEFVDLPAGKTDTTFNYLLVRFNLPIDANTLAPGRFVLSRDGEVVDDSLEVTQMDTEAKLFRVSGMAGRMVEDGEYTLTVDLPNIATIDGAQGLQQQTVAWELDTTSPELLAFTPLYEGGFDNQHVTGMEMLFSEPVDGFGLGAVELWKDDAQQPLSQVRFDSLGNNRYRITQFRLLTYYPAEYTLKLDMNNLYDEAGNAGDTLRTTQWSVSRDAPGQVENLRISPDNGFSDTDGVTSTRDLTAHMDVSDSHVTVELYKNDYGTMTLLADSGQVMSGELSLPFTVTSPGNVLLEVHTIDTSGNFSVTQLPIKVDESAFRVTFEEVPQEPVEDHPGRIRLVFTDRILASTLDVSRVTLRLKGSRVDLDGVTLTPVSDTVFAMEGLDELDAPTGTYTLSVNLQEVEKYESGLKGSYTAQTEWTVARENAAPVADAGSDFEIEPGKSYQLDATASYDPDGDPLTYQWFAPKGITLDDAFSRQPTFTAASEADTSGYLFRLSVNDGKMIATDQVQVTWKDTGTGLEASLPGEVTVYPNPTGGAFTVTAGGMDVESIRLIDFTGKTILHTNWTGEQEQTFRLEQPSPGMYVIMLRAADRVVMKKLIVE